MSLNEQLKPKQICDVCGRALPRSSAGVCPRCREEKLFHEVKDYINNNIVTEFDVAEHFNIPLSQVRSWVHDGRIEYVKNFLYEIPDNDK